MARQGKFPVEKRPGPAGPDLRLARAGSSLVLRQAPRPPAESESASAGHGHARGGDENWVREPRRSTPRLGVRLEGLSARIALRVIRVLSPSPGGL